MKEIKLLEAQINKLDAKDFDLDAWKQYTVVLLARIFGEKNSKIGQIEQIEYDYSSWALRDTSGKSSYMDTCKKLGREVIQASIDELNTFGLPDTKKEMDNTFSISIILEALEAELKISELKKLTEIVNSDKTRDKKSDELKTFVHGLDKDFPEKVILQLFSNPGLSFPVLK
ncbi:MAG: hypothetical protein K9G76_10125 [Bacteroidales bacterium]|nr:hypothetical protein [Bacteroidales bacterium]MCF8404057.1 hypothetical protein [Bacteroidales bacterium]